MERKLVTIRNILTLTPIVFINAEGAEETASAIECAQLDGWRVVVKKGEFVVGQPALFFEIDSVLPRKPWSEFLVDKNRPDKPIRLKSKKMKQVLSQGLALPLTAFSEEEQAAIHKLPQDDTADFSELLGVTKYESPLPACLSGMAKGNFPWFIPKTDAERIQNCCEKLRRYFDRRWYVSEKLDGTSFTCYLNNGEFGVCSRNLELKETEENLYWQTAHKLNLAEKLRKLTLSEEFTGIAVQGEVVGPGIQKNPLGLAEREFRLFNVYFIGTEPRYANFAEMLMLAEDLGLKTVPIIAAGINPKGNSDDFVAYAVRKSVINPDVWAEGVVFRPEEEIVCDRFGPVSFKAINNEFLLKQKD